MQIDEKDNDNEDYLFCRMNSAESNQMTGPGSLGSAQVQSEGSFTFPQFLDDQLKSVSLGSAQKAAQASVAVPQKDIPPKPVLGQSPAPGLLMQYKAANAKAPEKLPSFAEDIDEVKSWLQSILFHFFTSINI